MTRRRGRRNGFTLVEVCVAAMIVAIGATALFAVALSTRRTIAVSPIREQMHQYSRLLLETLKTHVTSDTAVATGAPYPTLGSPWRLCPPDKTNSDGTLAWALSAGNHNADCFLTPALTGAPVNAHLLYAVSVQGGARRITVTMNWDEPD